MFYCSRCGQQFSTTQALGSHRHYKHGKVALPARTITVQSRSALIPASGRLESNWPASLAPVIARSLESPCYLPPGAVTRQQYIELMNQAEPHVRFANLPFQTRLQLLEHARNTGTPIDLLFGPAPGSSSTEAQVTKPLEPGAEGMSLVDWLTLAGIVAVVMYLLRQSKAQAVPAPPVSSPNISQFRSTYLPMVIPHE